MPVTQLQQPPKESRLIRDPDDTFIHNLKMKMTYDPAAPGATPMTVLCKDIEDWAEFNEKSKNVYKYEVLGGVHTFMAKQKLMEEDPQNPFFKVALADVYIGLTNEEVLCLAQRHNNNSHFVHKITH